MTFGWPQRGKIESPSSLETAGRETAVSLFGPPLKKSFTLRAELGRGWVNQ